MRPLLVVSLVFAGIGVLAPAPARAQAPAPAPELPAENGADDAGDAAGADEPPAEETPTEAPPPAVADLLAAAGATGLDQPLPLDELRLRLVPLPSEELVLLAKTWQGIVRERVTRLSLAEVALRRAEGAAREPLLEALPALQESRQAALDRMRAVVAELRRKGGEVAGYEQYMDAVASFGVEVADVTDTARLWSTVKGWLRSPEGGVRWAVNLALFLLTLLGFKVLGSVLGYLTERALRRFGKASELLRDFLAGSVRKAVFLVGVVMALSMLEVDTAPLLAAMGAAGFVVAFALQGTLSNFASGIMILLYRPYDVGDWVDVAGTAGTVSAMTLVSTTLLTADNRVVVVPNGMIWGDVIQNANGKPTRRIDLTFGIGYGDDIDKAVELLRETVSAHEKVLADPAPNVQVDALADSSVNLICRPWTRTGDYWATRWDLLRQVKQRFDAAGISIPFPQRGLHVYTAGSPTGSPAAGSPPAP